MSEDTKINLIFDPDDFNPKGSLEIGHFRPHLSRTADELQPGTRVHGMISGLKHIKGVARLKIESNPWQNAKPVKFKARLTDLALEKLEAKLPHAFGPQYEGWMIDAVVTVKKGTLGKLELAVVEVAALSMPREGGGSITYDFGDPLLAA